MKKSMLKETLQVLLLLALSKAATAQVTSAFSFCLKTDATTSAGIFTRDGTLVKILWNCVPYKAGTYKQYWDGTDNDGRLVTADSIYHVSILSNNVKCSWEGVIGNTSSAMSGSTVNHAMECISGMAFSGKNGYFATGYNEQSPPINIFDTSKPQSKLALLTKGGTTRLVTTDGNYVYWDGTDPNDTMRTFIYATRVSDNSEVTNFNFGSPVSVTYSRTYPSAIDVTNSTTSAIGGIAVQAKGKYIFASHPYANQLHVLDKATGALIKNISLASPTAVAVDTNNNVWVTSTNSLSKYFVNPDGSLSTAIVTINGLVAPLAAAVSPDGATIIVADGGSSQQLKAYSCATGASLWVYGKQGGYAVNAKVEDDKFYFANNDGIFTFISFAADGSFWVGDPGNCRAQHFACNRTHINSIMWQPRFYSSVVDPNNPTRVFADYREFKVDYSKSLDPLNGSWTLAENWGYNIGAQYNDQFFRFRCLTTFSNGRTYAFLRHGNNLAVVELTSMGVLRFTAIELPGLSYQILADGSLETATIPLLGKPCLWASRPLTGFDSLYNPVWGPSKVIATSPPATTNDPVYYGAGNSVVTSSNVLVSFDAGLPPYGSSGYHLGGIKLNDNKWLWRTAKSTTRDYNGAYPTDGAYDIGNNVQYAGSYVRSLGRVIIWGYHGEFWKNSQVNKWTLVYDDGLTIGQLGIAQPNYTEAAPMMSGNAYAASFVKDTSGNDYLYLNDESYHGGVHRWKITGVNTITEQSVPVTFSEPPHGLLAEYFTGKDLNIFNVKTKRIDSVVNITPGLLDSTVVSNPDNFSARWTGFIKPSFSQTYTFYATASNGVRLWVDRQLIIDKWTNNTTTQYSACIPLVAGQQYFIRMEYCNSTVPSASLSWSSSSQAKQIVPSNYLYPAYLTDSAGGTDLMDGLPFTKMLVNNMYGWARNAVNEDYTNAWAKWWSVTTGFSAYDRLQSPDVYMQFTQNTGVYTVTRDLGNNNALNSWEIAGIVDYSGNAPNDAGGNGGMYMEVLDNLANVIARVYPRNIYLNNTYNDSTNKIGIFSNNTILTQGLTANMQSLMSRPQPISISAANGLITFTYANCKTVTTGVFDAKSKWQNPKTLRFYFFGHGNNYGRNIDVKYMRFSKSCSVSHLLQSPAVSTSAAVTTSKLASISIYPNPVQTILHARYSEATEKSSLEIISIDGRILKAYAVPMLSTNTQLDVQFLPAGYYFLRFKNNSSMLTTPFIK